MRSIYLLILLVSFSIVEARRCKPKSTTTVPRTTTTPTTTASAAPSSSSSTLPTTSKSCGQVPSSTSSSSTEKVTTTTNTVSTTPPPSTTTTERTTSSAATTVTDPKNKKTWIVSGVNEGFVTEEYRTIEERYFDDELYRECRGKFGEVKEKRLELPKRVYGRKKRDLLKLSLEDASPVMPVLISTNFTECEMVFFANAMKHFEQRTCMKFVPFDPVTTPKPIVVASQTTSSNAGRCFTLAGAPVNCVIDGEQADQQCRMMHMGCSTGRTDSVTFRHELMHIIGFIHSQNSPYRGGPAEVWENSEYAATVPTYAIEQMEPWDIESLTSYVRVEHQLTDWDIYKINKHYECQRTTRGGLSIDQNEKPSKLPHQMNDVNLTTPTGPDPNDCHFSTSRGTNTVLFNAGVLKIDNTNNRKDMLAEYDDLTSLFCATRFSDFCALAISETTAAGATQTTTAIRSYSTTIPMKCYVYKHPSVYPLAQLERANSYHDPCSDVVYFNNRTICVQW